MSQVLQSTHFRNLNATGQNLSNGTCRVGKVIATNTSAAVAFVQIFNAAAADVTLGTTRPKYQIFLPSSTGYVDLSWEPHDWFETRMSVFSTTTTEGSTGSADGVNIQVWVD